MRGSARPFLCRSPVGPPSRSTGRQNIAGRPLSPPRHDPENVVLPSARSCSPHILYKQYKFLLDALLFFRDEITHADPPRAVEFAVYFMVVASRNRLFYPLAPQTRMVKISKEELKRELVRQLTGYVRNPT